MVGQRPQKPLTRREAGLANTIDDLSERLGEAPTATLLAAELGVDREDVIAALVTGNADYIAASATKAGMGSGERATVADVEDFLAQIGDRQALRPLLGALTQPELTAVLLRFSEKLPHSQIAERMGTSCGRVSRLLGGALDRIRTQGASASDSV